MINCNNNMLLHLLDIKRNYFNKVSFRLPASPSPAWVVVETIEFTSGQTGVASGATQTDKFDLGVA